MAQYGIVRGKQRAGWDDDSPLLPHLSVPEHVGTDTGLVDADGQIIYRLPRAIGFGRDEGW